MGSFSSKTRAVVRVQHRESVTTGNEAKTVTTTTTTTATKTNGETRADKQAQPLSFLSTEDKPSEKKDFLKEDSEITKQFVEPFEQNKPKARTKMSIAKGNIVVSCHSNNKSIAIEVQDFLEQNGYSVIIITNDTPCNLDVREQCIQWCDLFVVVVTFFYQRSPFCVELANYAKDKTKPVIGLLAQQNYVPTGSVGAISIAWGKCLDFLNDSKEVANSSMLKTIQEKLKDVKVSQVRKPDESEFQSSNDPSEETVIGEEYICIGFFEDGINVATMLKSGQGVSNHGAQANSMSQFQIKMGNPNSSNKEIIKSCKVYIPVMTPGYQTSLHCRQDFEYARACGKPIIPVKGQKFRPSGWLSLGIAGEKYYQLTDSEQAYTRFPNVPDSTPMNGFIYAVMDTSSGGHQTVEEREKVEIAGITAEIETIKAKLHEWPPKQRKRQNISREPPHPEKLVTQDTESLPFRHIDYTVTRMSFSPPKPLFDKNGLVIKQTFDVMLSYQWDIQTLVRNFYCDFDLKTFKTWMDVWGGMQGNINHAMATAIENSVVIIAFLTEKYQSSINCNLELQYAKQRNKPVVFIKVEQDLVLKNWIQEMVDKSICVEMHSIGDFGVMDKGVPKINRVAEAVRNLIKWAGTLPKQPPEDVSEEVYNLQNILENAKHALAEQENRKRFETCSRCGAQFENGTTSGCKKHRAYFMGGNIIAGRWVCCSQRDKESFGCEATDHITAKRTWQQMKGFSGCYQWNPQ